jgi:hypothetical protein
VKELTQDEILKRIVKLESLVEYILQEVSSPLTLKEQLTELLGSVGILKQRTVANTIRSDHLEWANAKWRELRPMVTGSLPF